MTVAVASGKGGAGKTSLAAALSVFLAPACVVADCDVDAANGALALGAHVRETESYDAGPGYRIVPEACTGCGACAQACRFGAIRFLSDSGTFAVVPELCERCGACLDRCPATAIGTYEKTAGHLFVSDTRPGVVLVHAELVPGEDTSGKLVRRVRERADALACRKNVVVVDSPPGIGCPVIASLSGVDLVVVVVEASVSGVRDASRLVELLARMRRNAAAVINKTGLDPAMDAGARELVRVAGIPVAGELPFDPRLRSVEASRLTWAEIDGSSGARVRNVLETLGAFIGSAGRGETDRALQEEEPS